MKEVQFSLYIIIPLLIGIVIVAWAYIRALAKIGKLTIKKLVLEEKVECLEKLSGIDPLTQILNRRRIEILGKRLWQRKAMDKEAIAVLMIDIDNFKLINDEYGHIIGDKYLREVANTLSANIRPSDLLGRYGGEEFILVLSELSFEEGEEIAERFRKAIEEMNIHPYKKITISVGLSWGIPEIDFKNEGEMVNTADKALYAAKLSGKNKVVTNKK